MHELAARYGVTERTVRKWLKAGMMVGEPGFRPPREGRRPYKLTDSQVAEIRSLSALPLLEIARRYGISESYACRLRSGKRRSLVV